jgi:hypothetical protein
MRRGIRFAWAPAIVEVLFRKINALSEALRRIKPLAKRFLYDVILRKRRRGRTGQSKC